MLPSLAVFARNFADYLSAAADIGEVDPRRLVTFRSRVSWRAAEQELRHRSSIPIYIAPIDGGSYITFMARLRQILLYPTRTSPATHKMFKHDLDLTKGEGLWERYKGGKVKTLYEISECRQVHPFPQSELVKRDGTRLHRNFRYNYAIVRARPQTEPEFKPSAPDRAVPPRRIRVSIDRVVRNTQVVRDLKRLYSNHCQLVSCLYRTEALPIAGGRSYSEGHHLKPLQFGGVDHPSNVVILCPNHHAQSDLGGLRLRKSDLYISRRHPLDQQYIDFHNRRIASAS